MSKHTYPWHTWPGRAVVGLAGLAASVWRDWFPRKTCDRCRYYRDHNGEHCYRQLGYGYGRPVPEEYTCEHWHELRHCPYCKATDHDLDHCPERWIVRKESK